MTPLIKCPGCKVNLSQLTLVHNKIWFTNFCRAKCPTNYSQYHRTNFEDNDIVYFSFDTLDFNVKVYIDLEGSKDKLCIYNKTSSREELYPKPFFTCPRFKIEWDKLDYYNERWKLLRVFS